MRSYDRECKTAMLRCNLIFLKNEALQMGSWDARLKVGQNLGFKLLKDWTKMETHTTRWKHTLQGHAVVFF